MPGAAPSTGARALLILRLRTCEAGMAGQPPGVVGPWSGPEPSEATLRGVGSNVGTLSKGDGRDLRRMKGTSFLVPLLGRMLTEIY